jgi:glycosyltransferase involved in cell wall biosynthesis
MKPVLFVTGHVPGYRVGALARLNERERIEVALFGGRSKHGGAPHSGELPFAHRQVRPLALQALVSSGRYRAVVCPTGGRLAPLASWAGARRARIPLILWASLWAHPRTAAHVLTYLPLRRLYAAADAVVTYGPHVSAYVGARGAHNIHVAPQSVDNDFWRSAEVTPPHDPSRPTRAGARFLFVGREAPEKGLEVLLDAWRASGLRPPQASLILAGVGADPPLAPAGPAAAGSSDGVVCAGVVEPLELRNMYAAADVLVLPSIPTRSFREPWGLVVNEAMNRGLAVIASDAVGAVAGRLVRDGETGLVVPAGDSVALADALFRLAADAPLRARLGAAGTQAVLAYSHDAWAEGFSRALADVGVSRANW